MRRILGMTVVCVLLSTSWGQSAVVDETEIDEQVREIAKTLRCTVCQTENIWESGAPLAHQMRDAVRERVIQGQSAEEIRTYFHSRYGDYIMMEPPKHGLNWLVWAGPFVLLFFGGFMLYRELGRWVSGTPAPSPDKPEPLDEEARRRIKEELQP